MRNSASFGLCCFALLLILQSWSDCLESEVLGHFTRFQSPQRSRSLFVSALLPVFCMGGPSTPPSACPFGNSILFLPSSYMTFHLIPFLLFFLCYHLTGSFRLCDKKPTSTTVVRAKAKYPPSTLLLPAGPPLCLRLPLRQSWCRCPPVPQSTWAQLYLFKASFPLDLQGRRCLPVHLTWIAIIDPGPN